MAKTRFILQITQEIIHSYSKSPRPLITNVGPCIRLMVESTLTVSCERRE